MHVRRFTSREWRRGGGDGVVYWPRRSVENRSPFDGLVNEIAHRLERTDAHLRAANSSLRPEAASLLLLVQA